MTRWSHCLPPTALAIAFVATAHCSPFASNTTSSTTSQDAGADGDSAVCAAADPQNDPRNCGSCGHDCDQGGCVRGLCLPYVLGTATSPWYIAVDDTNVYFTSFAYKNLTTGDGQVRTIPKLGGPLKQIAASPQSFDVIAVNGTVYFSAGAADDAQFNGLFSVSRDGGTITPLYPNYNVGDIALHNNQLFFGSPELGTINIYTLGATAPDVAFALPNVEVDAVEGVAVDDNFIYWTNHHDDDAANVQRATRDKKSQDVVAEKQTGARRLAVDDDALYWTSSTGDGGITRMQKINGAPTQILKAKVEYGSFLIDGPWLYVAVAGENRIVRIDKANGANPITLADGLSVPTGLAQDDRALYFTERTSGNIKRLRK